ncbi:MAG: bifunctional RNase H/acid phosphatase [Micrococcales bacterium]
MAQQLIIEADGGSRGNPGTAGSGAVVIDASTGQVIREIARYIGVATNNVAEYVALIAGLQAVIEINADAEVLVRMDSKLVIEQMSGGWKIKHPDMIALGAQVQDLASQLSVKWQWIPREQNTLADALANRAMDELADYDSGFEAKPSAFTTEFNLAGPTSIRAPKVSGEPLTTLVLVRHGRTALTESHKISGGDGDDPQLSEAGRSDAAAAASVIRQLGRDGRWKHIPTVSVVVASPMNRTRETAEIIADSIDLPVALNDNLREIGFGDWDGLTNEEVAAKTPEALAAWQGSFTVSPPNGESLEVFDLRINRAREQIVSEFAGKTVVVVAHVMPVRGFIKWALDAGESAYWRPQVAPCSITIIRVWGDSAAEVLATNITSHL